MIPKANSHFCQPFIPFFTLIIGKATCSVSVLPNGTEMIASALTAQPLALSTGARLRRRSLSHAIIILGPLMTSNIHTNTISSCHQYSFARPAKHATHAVPIIPNAMPMAAKIPANFAMSNAGFFSAAGSAAAPSAFDVISSKDFASFSAADLLILS